MHDFSIIITLAGGLAVALVFGWVTQRLGLSTLVGYMLAGIVVGPYTPGFVADAGLASQMAEIGVILLMFGVGLHFHPQELLRVWRIAVPGAVAQSAVAAVAGWAIARAFGWSHAAGDVVRHGARGREHGRADAHARGAGPPEHARRPRRGRLADRRGPLHRGRAGDAAGARGRAHRSRPGWRARSGSALGKAAVFAALVWAAGSRLVAPAMERIARTRSTELFTLTVFVVALGVALLAAEVFSVSVALGAFFAGLVVGQSRFGPQAAADMVPFRDVFSALFFVSVGMLFNPGIVTSQPLLLAGALVIVLVVKPLVALAIVKLLRDTQRTALTVAVGLAQIGEFSFILGVLGQQLGILPPAGMDILVAAAIVSIALNPLLFRAVAAREARLAAGSADAPTREGAAPIPESGPAVALTGLGELGRRVVQRCAAAGVPVSVIDADPDALAELRGRGLAVVRGDPADPEVLRAAGMADARMILVTNPALADKMQICIAARQVNPRIAIVATSGSAAERAWLHEFGAAFVCDAIDEMTESLVRTVRDAL